jgi:hypothetical protein
VAQQHAFLHGPYPLGQGDPEWLKDNELWLWSGTAAELVTREDLDAVVLSYGEVGYRHLPLLTQTDVKRMVGAYGEPKAHLNIRERHASVWERLREVARARNQHLDSGLS